MIVETAWAAGLTGITVAWLAFVVLHRLLSGRSWVWLVPDLVPPVSYLAGPLVLLAAVGLIMPAEPLGLVLGLGLTAALALGVVHSGLNRPASARARAETPPDAVRIVVWNTEYWTRGVRADRLYEYLRAVRADVYVLQEYLLGVHTDPLPVHELPRLRAEFPGYHIVTSGELLTLSRFPVVATPRVGPAGQLRPGSPWRAVFDSTKVLRTDLRLGDRVLSVYNVHIPAQVVAKDNPLRPGFCAELRDRDARRKAQFAGLREDVGANRNPVLVAGDFNSTGAMGELRALSATLASANRAARCLYPASWPARGPALWQLDWAFTARMRVHSYRFLDPRGLSDHRMQELLVSVEGAGDVAVPGEAGSVREHRPP